MKRSDSGPVPVLAVALLAVLAGCPTTSTVTTTTTAGGEDFEVRLTGDSSATYVVSADLVADPFENVTVTYANGTSRVVEVPDRQGAVTFGPESEVTGVEPGGEVVGGGYFEGPPNFSVTAHDSPPTGNVVYSIREQGEEVLVAWGLIRCDGRVTDVSFVTNESSLTGVGFGCES